ncbi:dullard-like phosphatase domain protein [Clavispora lusitaniae]|uniref:FCP1 homology domain-containing protein n=1 Tax=Clavispora lusitaniae (strain ATCC 42720) TaxID=306902 RepID=C4Y330_CLAL4|nr:uncharacterized protein CLUG_02943 [Clavispora lusitaniae ATCC 42720]EEQ38817.1 hypothetical protein CLUG_02943 [Clavispora lusitaniae ATCC 42720]KAF5211016.1 hypothetical protein E0198_002306 [Clavispora lusitaniae]KAF7579821.1 dullard-like phosphatase domain protein [Clavispora lusitaniae]
MGLFTSLLCCGDANDEHTNKNSHPTKRHPPAQQKLTAKRAAPASGKTDSDDSDKPQVSVSQKEVPQKTQQKSKKDMLDDDHSVNETDTITNTNEESNTTPIIAENNEQSNNNAPVLDSDEIPPTEPDVAPSAIEELMDNESELDLSKIQEGQAFNPETGFLLGKKDIARFGNKKCLILDLDETLVHSSFKYLRTADFVIPVEIDNQVHHVYVIKRPGVDEFLEKVGRWFEVVVFTASVAKYGDPLLNKLDISKSVHHRLFRDSCYNHEGNFIKNLSQIGRPLSDSIIIDNSPASYIFHPQHSIPISSWFSDTHDNELLDLLPFLEDISKSNVDDVSLVLDITI